MGVPLLWGKPAGLPREVGADENMLRTLFCKWPPMYEQASHALLNEILSELKPEIGNYRLRHFYTRLGANFYAIYSLFRQLYGCLVQDCLVWLEYPEERN